MATSEDIEIVRQIVIKQDIVSLTGNHRPAAFGRLSLTTRQLIAICKANAEQWGYAYRKGEYHASGSGSFGRLSNKRAKRSAPSLIKLKK